jgi:hypothetical protein
VDQAGEFEIGVAANTLAIEAGKQRGGGGSVKTFVVIEDPYSQGLPQSSNRFPAAKPRYRRGIASRVKANRIDSLQEESQGAVVWGGAKFDQTTPSFRSRCAGKDLAGLREILRSA